MTLSKALKVARGFERQKLGRREKTAQKEEGEKKEGTLSRIAEEIQVVKVQPLLPFHISTISRSLLMKNK